eukprot:8382760-Alexandrium_andersonii.AAC.1
MRVQVVVENASTTPQACAGHASCPGYPGAVGRGVARGRGEVVGIAPVSYTHLRAHETSAHL